MAVEKDKIVPSEVQEDKNKFKLQAEIFLAVYSRPLMLHRQRITFERSAEGVQMTIDHLFHQKSLLGDPKQQPGMAAKISAMEKEYQDHPYFQLVSEILSLPHFKDLKEGECFTLHFSDDESIHYSRMHHFYENKEKKGTYLEYRKEIFCGTVISFNIPPDLLNPEAFPEQIEEVIFAEVEPETSWENFQKFLEQEPQGNFLRNLAVEFIDHVIGLERGPFDRKIGKFQRPAFVKTKKRIAICFIATEPTSDQYRLVLPPIIFEKGTDIEPVLRQNDQNLPLPDLDKSGVKLY